MSRSYLFVGGPLDGDRWPTDGRQTWYIAMPPPLEGLLEASIGIMEGKPTPMPSTRRGVYVKKRRNPLAGNLVPFDRTAYVWEGEE